MDVCDYGDGGFIDDLCECGGVGACWGSKADYGAAGIGEFAYLTEASGDTTEDISIDDPTLEEDTLETPRDLTESTTLPVEAVAYDQTLPAPASEAPPRGWMRAVLAFTGGLTAVLLLWRACS